MALFNIAGDIVLDPILFEDLPLGGAWTTRRRTISPADLAGFAGVAAEFSPLVVDEPYARETAFGGQIVPGTMISALAVGLGSLDVPLPATAGMVGMSWRYLIPVRPGDSLSTKWRLNRKRAVENPSVGLCFWQIEVLNQRGEIVATGEVGRLVQRRRHQGRATETNPTGATQPAVAVDEAEAAESPARRRRRRGGRGGGGGGGAQEVDQPSEMAPPADLPEPAPADTPAAGRRRRRRGGRGSGNGSTGSAPSHTELAPPPPPVETGPAPSTRRTAAEGGLRGVLRRLRGT